MHIYALRYDSCIVLVLTPLNVDVAKHPLLYDFHEGLQSLLQLVDFSFLTFTDFCRNNKINNKGNDCVTPSGTLKIKIDSKCL